MDKLPFVPGPNVAQVDLIYSQSGEPVQNVFYVQGTAPWTATSLNALAQAFTSWETASMHGLRHAATGLVKVRCRDLTTQNSTVIEWTANLPINGTQPAQALPNNVTLAVAHRTGLSGRSFRGRTYHIGLTVAQVTGNTIIDAQATALLVGYNALLGPGVFPNGGSLVCFSRVHGGVARNPGLATAIQNFTIDRNLDSQRRRLPGHNRHR